MADQNLVRRVWSVYARLLIGSWFRYFSPYPLTETEINEHASGSTPGPTHSHVGSSISAGRIPGVARASLRSHGRTSDLLAGGLGRNHGAAGEKSTLWVCDKCFKYMAEGQSWELHVVSVGYITSCCAVHLQSTRENVPSSIPQAERCTKEELTSFGNWMVPSRRCVSFR